MMKGKYIILTLAAIACISCNKEDRGRRDDGRDPSREPVPESSFVENPAWTITYTGREALLSDELTYVVDALHVKSTDSGSWFLDVVSANDYLTEYNNKLESFISASVKAAKEGGYLEVENADADIVFDILDEGGCNWIAIAYGCDDKGNLTGEYTSLNFTTQAIELRKTDDFKMSYKGRQTIVEDGKDVDVDVVSVTSSKPYSYYVYLAYPEYIADEFDGNYYDFFNSVVDEVYDSLGEGEYFADAIYYDKTLDIQFDRLRSGSWTAYAIGLDAAGNFLGYWSEYAFSVAEEKPTDEFNRWLGTWEISDGDISFDLKVSNSESNIAYLVSGWEVGKRSEDKDMNEYTATFSFETRFDRGTGDMVFYNQYIGLPYTVDDYTYDLYLLGIYLQGGNECVNENVCDIARATLQSDAKATVIGLSYGGNDFITMRYVDLCRDESITDAFTYGLTVPYFPMTMTWKSSDTGSRAAASAASRDRIGTALPKTAGSADQLKKSAGKSAGKADIRKASGTVVRGSSPAPRRAASRGDSPRKALSSPFRSRD